LIIKFDWKDNKIFGKNVREDNFIWFKEDLMNRLEKKLGKKYILWAVIILAFAAGLVSLVQRHRVEAENTRIEMIMDYATLKEFSASIGVPPLTILEQLREVGITSVAVAEDTLKDLLENSKVTALTGKELLNMQRISGKVLVEETAINPNYIYLVPENNEAQRLYERLSKRLGADSVALLTEGQARVIQLTRSGEKLDKLGVGFNYELIEAISRLGFKIVARPYNFPGITEEDIRETFKELEQYADLSTVVFAGDDVYGYPDQMKVTAQILKDLNINYGAAETPVQRGFVSAHGLDEMFKLMDYQVLRVYSATVSEIKNPTIANLVDNAVRSVKERNIRALYLKPITNFPQKAPEEQLKINLDYVRDIKKELERQNYKVGIGEPFAPFYTNRYLTAFVIAGITAAAFLLLNLFYPLPVLFELFLTGLAWLVSLFLLRSSQTVLFRQAVAILAATVFPTLAVAPLFNLHKDLSDFKTRFGKAGLIFLRTVGLSILGGLFIAALLGDVYFLIEYYYFRGVKLVHILPLLLLILVYFRNKGAEQLPAARRLDRIKQVYLGAKEFYYHQVYFGHLMILVLLAVAGYIYIGRTGHTAGIPVPNIEVQLRAFLDKILYIRPRTKEFLIGHPGLILGVYLAFRGHRRFTPLILIGSAIGQISLVNTFAHLRTPVLLSLFRTLNGVWLGLIMGLIFCLVGEVVLRIIEGLRRSVND
jgi:hypothetical protein